MYSLATLFVLVVRFVLILPANGLYFYMDGSSPKCFFEELPKDTLVVGEYHIYFRARVATNGEQVTTAQSS